VEAKADEILTQWNKAGAATTIEELRAAFWALRHALAAADIPLAYMQFVAASRIGGLIRAYGRSLLAPAAYRALEDVFEMDVVPVSEEGATRSWMIVPRAPANS
jgi:hypothetical protein